MKYILKIMIASLALVLLASCDDFFNPENGTVKYGEDYIGEGSELYSGFVGVITKMQAIGDKAIYLTDTRGELLEPTGNSPELYAIYNYDSDLTGNSYADPAGYYDLIISCNDYLEKAREFKKTRPTAVDDDHYKGLISNTLRLKAWTYFTLGKIYGQAIWFDDPMWELKDYKQYPVKNLDEIISSCVDLLQTGFDGIDGTHNMSWTEWITNSNDDSVSSSNFIFWDVMVPPYWVLAAELALWQERYDDVVKLILPEMNAEFDKSANNSVTHKYMFNAGYHNSHDRIFDDTANGGPADFATVSVIRYKSEKNQTNELNQHFRTDNYKLRPVQVAMDRYSDPEFSPREDNRTDTRFKNYFREMSGEWLFAKYCFSATYVGRYDNHIYTYHSAELYFMLIEAFNHLKRYNEMDALMNKGIDYHYSNYGVLYDGFSLSWSSKNYADTGVRYTFSLNDRKFKPCDTPDNIEYNDREILKEIILSQAGEGKTYPAMIRMARRYNDLSFITDYVCPKYKEAGLDGTIEKRITSKNDTGTEGYFVPWDLDSVSSSH